MTKYVYAFTEGNKDMRNLLGGKGANLAEMTNLGLPIPKGFTITTEACINYYKERGQCSSHSETARKHYKLCNIWIFRQKQQKRRAVSLASSLAQIKPRNLHKKHRSL